MPTITLPDGTQKQFEQPVSVYDIALSIGSGLAKAALAGEVGGKLVDTFFIVNADAKVRIITDRDPAGLEIIRHSAAHLLAQAVKILFPKAQVTIGPVIENGFYYDFSYDRPFSTEDLNNIEVKMQEIVDENYTVSREVVSRDEAIAYFEGIGEHYKVKIIQDIPGNETLTIYKQDGFADLCRGPHVPRTGMIKAFKLMKVSGAYWRGDSNNEMLQRIYGTAWPNKKALDEYLKNLEEAEKRDHRKIAKQMDLFHIQEEAPGMIFWHEKGWLIYQEIKRYISDRLLMSGYQEVSTPQIVDLELWKKSGHWGNFNEEMFTLSSDDRQYAVKPMNCPCHILIFKQGLRSYRDLPMRLAEYGTLHRNELSGSMHGLMRVRQLVQDDAHIFCTDEQIQIEASNFIKLLMDVYQDFGFDDITIRLAARPDKRMGSDELWDFAEGALADALKGLNLDFEIRPKEGAFYGPKIEFHLKDCIGRMWQCGTLQLDYSMPARLEASYIAEDGSKKVPAMLHRAILGSMERFIGILLEQYAGKLPVWLAPVQIMAMNITDNQAEYTQEIVAILKKHGFRVKSDLRNEKIGFKIREHTLDHVPYLLVIGDREVESDTISVRTQDGADLGKMTTNQLIDLLKTQIAKRGRTK
ncbi:MAG: threonine--tRNA ligase [Gammaproteobacteria bacterium]|nr:threonine--tRNA ligase [Gammaproteobacteria bacterium]